jgi:hypothetical protein
MGTIQTGGVKRATTATVSGERSLLASGPDGPCFFAQVNSWRVNNSFGLTEYGGRSPP